MKIAFVTDHFLPKTDGIVTRLYSTIYHLLHFGHDVQVHTLGKAGASDSEITIHRYQGYHLPFYPERWVSRPHFWRLTRHLYDWEPDIIHVVNATLLSLPAYYYSWRRHCPLIGSIHTDYLNYLTHYNARLLQLPVRLLLRMFSRFNHLTLCPSDAMKEKLHSYGITNIGIWQKGVNNHQFRPNCFSADMRSLLAQKSPDLPLIIYVGRLSAEKNLSILRSLFAAIPELRLALIGDGPVRGKLEREFSGTHTYFPGYLHGDELSAAYASADLLVMPSTSETLGLAVLEALASGCPVVAANAGGLPEVIKHGISGYLFDADQPSQMIAFVKTLLTNPSLRKQFSLAARQEAEKWDWREATVKLIDTYAQTKYF